jgi:hypothetical protein
VVAPIVAVAVAVNDNVNDNDNVVELVWAGAFSALWRAGPTAPPHRDG